MELNIFCLLFLFSVCYARNALPDHTDQKFLDECLAETNSYRIKHHSPALHIDQKAVQYAKSRCHLISQYESLSHGHAGLEGYGENLYWGGGQSLDSCAAAINGWYNEVKSYNFKRPGFGMSTGHFTQLVWKSTTGVGCARCGGQGGQYFETYIVCNYSPPGNYLGQFPRNVLRP